MTKFFKVLGCDKLKSVPWGLVEPHREQAFKNHRQTLERLNSRGGLGIEELYTLLEGHLGNTLTEENILEYLLHRIKTYEDKSKE